MVVHKQWGLGGREEGEKRGKEEGVEGRRQGERERERERGSEGRWHCMSLNGKIKLSYQLSSGAFNFFSSLPTPPSSPLVLFTLLLLLSLFFGSVLSPLKLIQLEPWEVLRH